MYVLTCDTSGETRHTPQQLSSFFLLICIISTCTEPCDPRPLVPLLNISSFHFFHHFHHFHPMPPPATSFPAASQTCLRTLLLPWTTLSRGYPWNRWDSCLNPLCTYSFSCDSYCLGFCSQTFLFLLCIPLLFWWRIGGSSVYGLFLSTLRCRHCQRRSSRVNTRNRARHRPLTDS